MRGIKVLTIIILVWSTIMFAEDKVNYKFYKKFEATDYDSIVENIKDCDIIFFGELHNNIEAHEIELKLTEDLFAKRNGKLTLGAEMFEADNQLTIDEYFADFE